jgi:hypothetical protein
MEIINNYNLNLPSYPFLNAFIHIFDETYPLLNSKEQYNYNTEFCNYLAHQVNTIEVLNKLSEFPKLRIKRNSIFLDLLDTKINNNVKTFISIFFDINIIVLINKNYYNINTYNNTFGTIILINNNYKYIPIKKIFNNLEIIELQNNINEELILKYVDETDFTESNKNIMKLLKRYKLPELKEFVQNYDINTTGLTKNDIYNYVKNNILSN